MKRKTIGLDKKVPAQLVATLLAWALAHYGIELDDETSTAFTVVISAVVGALLGILAPAPQVVAVPKKKGRRA